MKPLTRFFKKKHIFAIETPKFGLTTGYFLAKQVVFNNSVYLQNNFKIFEALNVYSLDGISMLLPYLISLNTILKICA